MACRGSRDDFNRNVSIPGYFLGPECVVSCIEREKLQHNISRRIGSCACKGLFELVFRAGVAHLVQAGLTA